MLWEIRFIYVQLGARVSQTWPRVKASNQRDGGSSGGGGSCVENQAVRSQLFLKRSANGGKFAAEL